VVKPAPDTPLTAFALIELAIRAGFPKGVLNIVTGDAVAIGKVMTSHPAVRFIGFTGSTPVGKLLMQQAASTVKKVGLELGGNAPFIVFDDADIDAAVQGAVIAKYRNMGQTCVCTNRLLVQDGIHDEFVAKFAGEVAKMKVGDGTEVGVVQGPLINERAVEKVERHVADAVAQGGRVVVGGKRHALGRTFYEPTVISGVTTKMLVTNEETFGPIAPVYRFSTEDEAVAMANDTPFGLASYFYTKDLGRAFRVAEELEYGMVGINSPILGTEVAPFGGVKESGLGREGSLHGMDEFVEIKYILMGGLGA
jgi:succinate-semialdehyde dehydrogenase/glutarate-semialdehyde dehydrogenase